MSQDSEIPNRGGALGEVLLGARIASVVDPFSSIPNWLDEAGATRIELWGQRDALTAEGAREATRNARAIVIDFDLGVSKAFRIAATVSPACGVLFTSESIDAATCSMIRHSHWGYRSKHASRDDFLLAVRRIVRLQVPDIDRLAARAVQIWNLSPQQARVLHYDLWTYCDQDIADALDLSIHTVQEYQEDLRKRTGARSKRAYLARLLEVSGALPPLPASPSPRRGHPANQTIPSRAERPVIADLVPTAVGVVHG